MRVSVVIIFVLWALPLLAGEEETHNISFENLPTPWFTGPLIAPSGYTVPPGHFSLQPFFNSFVNVGTYNSHWKARSTPNFYNANLRVRVKAGVLKWLDVQLTPQVTYQETQGKHSVGFGDLFFTLNFQLLTYELKDPWPALKLILSTSIPSGKYQKLKPSLKATDAMGTGCWYPEAAIVLSKLWYLSGIHYFEARLYTGYRIATPTSVKGLSFYGGDRSTRGTSYPGNIFYVDGAFQYNFTQSFVLACDVYYLHRDRSRFSGHTKEAATRPSEEQFSLAPALEYNWNEDIGIIGGVWFSVAGRNTPQFINGILSLNAYF